MASERRQLPHRTPAIGNRRLALAVALLAVALLALMTLATRAGAEVVYDNPAAAGEVEALGFEASGTAELGALLRLGGSARLDPRVSLTVIADACGDPAPGTTFALPATLSVYAANPDGSPGPLLARQAKTFQLAAQGRRSLTFELAGVTLPPEAIFSVAFETGAGAPAPTELAAPAEEVVAVALAGPAAVGANPREVEGVYRAATPAAPGAAPVLGFEPEPMTWEGRQPAFTVEAAAAPGPGPADAAAAPTAATATAATMSVAPDSGRRAYLVPASKRMRLRFSRRVARIAGPGALVQVRCTGSSAARCIGTLSLTAAGAVHKAPYSIGKGRRQYIVVPLGSDLELIEGRGGGRGVARATARASTVQVGGAAVRTKRALKLK